MSRGVTALAALSTVAGMVELVCAALLVNPKTRQVGGLASAAISDDPHSTASSQVLTFVASR